MNTKESNLQDTAAPEKVCIHYLQFWADENNQEIMRWAADGRIWWREREVKTDDELRQMIKDIHGFLKDKMGVVG